MGEHTTRDTPAPTPGDHELHEVQDINKRMTKNTENDDMMSPPLSAAIPVLPPTPAIIDTTTNNRTTLDDGTDSPSAVESKRSTLQIAIIMTCLCSSIFVSALDITIVTTSLPSIAGHFRSATAYTWVGSSYTLAYTSMTPNWGKVSDIWGRKPVLLLAVLVFFAGSLMCAVVNGIGAFLAGRAIQGAGAAGLATMVNICISDLFSLRDRGLYFGLTSVVWAFASAVGPVLGGLFTQKLSWRWCFWINLPITGAVFVLLLFTLHLDSPRTPFLKGIKAIDWSGSFLLIGGTVMLLLGLTFGGVMHPWDSAIVVCLIVFGVITLALFLSNEWKIASHAIIPLRLFRNRSNIACFAMCFCHGYVFVAVAYYLPLYFQAVLGAGPLLSGVYLLPYVLSISIVAAMTGVYIQQTGKYILTVYIGLPITILGIGLLIDIDVHVDWAKLVTFQIIAGTGIGMNFEAPLLAMQAAIDVKDMATGTATFGFFRTLSTAVSVVIGGVVFQNQMANQAPELAASIGPELAGELSGGDAAASIGLIDTLSPSQKVVVQQALNRSLRDMWIMYVAFAALALFAGCFIAVHTLSRHNPAAVVGLVDQPKDSTQNRADSAAVRDATVPETADTVPPSRDG